MDHLFDIAEQMQKQAWKIIEETNIINLWSSIGATANLVGSVKTGLLINNRDIDLHVYTNPFVLADSFLVLSRLAENKHVRKIEYANLLEAEDQCIEWHAFYDDGAGQSWRIDMMHILQESPYAGYFENVAERISDALTKETRTAILKIKHSIPNEQHVPGIHIYRAVLEGGVRDVDSFWRWREQHPESGIVAWAP